MRTNDAAANADKCKSKLEQHAGWGGSEGGRWVKVVMWLYKAQGCDGDTAVSKLCRNLSTAADFKREA